jgi:hypothetical protein
MIGMFVAAAAGLLPVLMLSIGMPLVGLPAAMLFLAYGLLILAVAFLIISLAITITDYYDLTVPTLVKEKPTKTEVEEADRDPEPQPDPSPPPVPIPPVLTPTPEPQQEFVADTGVFADRARDLTQRVTIDTQYLNQPNIVLYASEAVVIELNVSPSTSQFRRLNAKNVIIVPDASPAGINVVGLKSKYFDETDMIVLTEARNRSISVLTTKSSMVDQVQSHAGRMPIWGMVPIRIP